MDDRSAPFIVMADKIGLNKDYGFGGAFVVVPPGEDAAAVTLLMLDDGSSPAMFWSNLQTMAAIALQKIEDENRPGGAYR